MRILRVHNTRGESLDQISRAAWICWQRKSSDITADFNLEYLAGSICNPLKRPRL